MSPRQIFDREPALWLAFIAAALQMLSEFWFPLDDSLQAGINAVAAALFGFITAWRVRDGKVAAAAVGLLSAVLALATELGVPVDSGQNNAITAILTAVLGLFVRTQATARVNARGEDVGVAPTFENAMPPLEKSSRH